MKVAGFATALLATAVVHAPAGQGGERSKGDDGLVIGTVLQRWLDSHEGPLMRDAGIESVRFWLSWSAVEFAPDQFSWAQPDDAIREIVDQGLTPMPFLFGTPTWAAKRDGFRCDASTCGSFAPASTDTRSQFAEFAAAAVRRYGPGGVFWENNPGLPYHPISVWQLWNEPNLQSYWRPNVNAASYAKMVQAAAGEVRDEDPGAEVVLAGLSGDRSTSKRLSTQAYLRQLYRVPGFADSFEGVAVHPYSPRTRGVLDQIETVRSIASAHDGSFDVWITEIGWASGGRPRWALVKTLRGQARMLRRVFGRLIRHADEWNLRGVYWYAWRDTERGHAVCGWCGAAGLRDRDGGPKPAYHELRLLAGG